MRRRILQTIFVITAAALLALAFAARSMQRAIDRMRAAGDAFLNAHPDAASHRSGIFAVSNGPTDATATFILIHGSPGRWSDFGSYVADRDLTEEIRVIAPDRPGYGLSTAGSSPPSLSDQAARLATWAEDLPPGKRFWLGHSFGASIVARLAIDRPDLADGLVLLSGAMEAQWERPRWFHAVANTSLARRTLAPEILEANAEALAYYADLAAMEPEWHRIQCPVIILHAKNDRLADFRHVAFAQKQLDPTRTEVIALEDGDHFLPWNRKHLVEAAMLRMAGVEPGR